MHPSIKNLLRHNGRCTCISHAHVNFHQFLKLQITGAIAKIAIASTKRMPIDFPRENSALTGVRARIVSAHWRVEFNFEFIWAFPDFRRQVDFPVARNDGVCGFVVDGSLIADFDDNLKMVLMFSVWDCVCSQSFKCVINSLCLL